MLKLKLIILSLLMFVGLRAGAQTLPADSIEMDAALRKVLFTAVEIIDVYNTVMTPELLEEISNFEASTGINVYALPHLNDTTFFSRLLNSLVAVKHEQYEAPYLVFNVNFEKSAINLPGEDPSYRIEFDIEGSPDMAESAALLNEIMQELNELLSDAINLKSGQTISDAIISALRRLFGPAQPEIKVPYVVNFEKSGSNIYGFDNAFKQEFISEYDKVRVNQQDYNVAWKSLSTGNSDYVKAAIIEGSDTTIAGFNRDSIKFRLSRTNTDLLAFREGDNRILTIPSQGSDGTSTLEAYISIPDSISSREILLGQLGIVSYEPQNIQVVLVPVNGSSVPDAGNLKYVLDSIYRKSVTDFTVEIAPAITISTLEGNFNEADDDIKMNYTGDMKLVISELKSKSYYDEEKYYLFFINNSNATLEGYMPYKKHFGFIFSENPASDNNIGHTIAHELGHGVFRLRHTFVDYPSMPSGSTDNLMDYALGTSLYKYQWDYIHNPQITFNWLHDEGEGEMAFTELQMFSELQNYDGSYSFLNPAGKIVTLPSNAEQIIFSSYDLYYYKDGSSSGDFNPIGSLISFKIGNTKYLATASSTQNLFGGYKSTSNSSDYYEDKITATLNPQPTSGICLIPTVEDNTFVGYAARFDSPVHDQVLYGSKGIGQLQNGLFICDLKISDLAKTVTDYFDSKVLAKVRIPDLNVVVSQNFQLINTIPPILATDYVKDALDDSSPLADVLTFFSIIYLNPEAIEALEVCNTGIWKETNFEVIYEIKRYNNNYYYGNGESRTVDGPEIEHLVNEQAARSYLSYNEIQGAIRLKEIVDFANSIEQINDGLEMYHSSCVLSALDLSTRLSLLNWLLISDSDYWEVSDRNIIYELISNAPESHQVPILQKFQENNYKLLYSLWDEGSDDEREQVIDLISQLVSENFNELNIQPTTTTVILHELGSFGGVPIAQSPCAMNLDEGELLNISQQYGIIRHSGYDDELDIEFIEGSGKIRFTQEYYLRNLNIIYPTWTSLSKYDSYIDLDYSINPFEPVTVYFGRNFSSLGILENTAYTVPAIWALRMEDATGDEVFNENLRLAGNIAAIALVPFSGGGSSYIAVITNLSGVVAAADIYVQAEKNDSPVYEEFYDTWDQFVLAVGVLDLAANAPQIVRSIAKISAIPRSFQELRAVVNNLPTNAPASILKAWDEVLGVRVESKLWTSIDEFDGVLNNKVVTYYDVNVTYQPNRVRAGIAFEENGILNFDINLPVELQGQGISSEIFQRAIQDYSPNQVQGLWKTSGNYLGGESINLSIYKQKLTEGMTPIQAVFETPTGKILKANGFDGTPTIVTNNADEVRVLFNPSN